MRPDILFRKRIAIALAFLDMNASELARRLDITPQTFSQIICGKRPGYKHLLKIAELLHSPVDWLVHGTGRPPEWLVDLPELLSIKTVEKME